MAQTLPSVALPRNQWIDLYDATGITVGNQIVIQNIGTSDAILFEDNSEPPAVPQGKNNIKVGGYLTNKAGNIGAWGLSRDGSELQVEEA